MWMNGGSSSNNKGYNSIRDAVIAAKYYPVVCVSASETEMCRKEITLDSYNADAYVSDSNPIDGNEDKRMYSYSYTYVPGAGDDEESWSNGLTPERFWQLRQKYDLHTANVSGNGNNDLDTVLDSILDSHNNSNNMPTVISSSLYHRHMVTFIGDSGIGLGDLRAAQGQQEDVWKCVNAIINLGHKTMSDNNDNNNERALSSSMAKPNNCGSNHSGDTMCSRNRQNVYDKDLPLDLNTNTNDISYLRIILDTKSKHSLESHLLDIIEFAYSHLASGRRVLIQCDSGEDRSVCACLAILVELFDWDAETKRLGRLRLMKNCDNHSGGFDLDILSPHATPKAEVQQRLAYLSSFYPRSRPSRLMLKQVYNFCSRHDYQRHVHES